jgi:NADH-quinone oxidoreductase subunit J
VARAALPASRHRENGVIVQALVFYLFAFVAVASGVMVVSARNPVHSVLYLILAFFNGAGLFVLMGAEFLAMVLVVVYVGAVAVLFLFVVMMLDINMAELRSGVLQYLPIGALIGIVLLVELAFVFAVWVVAPEAQAVFGSPTPLPGTMTNTHALGHVLYTKYIYLFQAAGMVLLVAMIGAIVLTLREREGVRRQRISDQLARRKADTIELVKVTTRGGV